MNHKRTGLAALAVTVFGVAALSPEEPPTSARGEPVWSAQLHLHGPFSEGTASIDSHSFEARDVGADVLWWSEHDFRITSYGAHDRFGFEAKNEEAPMSPLVVQGEKTGRDVWLYEKHADRRAVGGWELVDDHSQGEHALLMRVKGKNKNFEGRYIRLGSENSRLNRPLAAGVKVQLAVKPLASGPDAHGVVLFDLSDHPVEPRGEEVDLEQLELRYVVGGPAFEPLLEGSTYSVHLAVPDDEWTEVELDVTGDAERGFPAISGRDNSLNRIGFGAEARAGTDFECLFDDLRLSESVPAGEMFAAQRELLGEVGQGYPSLRQLQGSEISYVAEHLNEFSVGTELLDYAALEAELEAEDRATPEEFRKLVFERAISNAHARGGLISLNHMFGASWLDRSKKDKRTAALEEVRDLLAAGVDLLEVGYVSRGGQRLSDHLWVWDKLSAEGLPVVGTGVSDSHGGEQQRWRTGKNNFVTWLFAPTTDKADLIEALRAGRVFFGDLVVFDGSFDLLTDRGFAMGQIVLTDRTELEYTILADGVRPNHSLHVIENARHVDTLFAKGIEYPRTLTLAPEGPTFVRAEIHDRQDEPKVFTNPLHFVRSAPAGGIPAARAGLDYAGLVVERFEGFDLLGAERDAAGAVVLRGLADGGAFTLDTSRFGSTPEVALQDMEGQWEPIEGGLAFKALAGSGTIRITASR